MPPALPLKSLPLTSVFVASSTETPGPVVPIASLLRIVLPSPRDEHAALAAPDRVPLDEVVVGGQQVVAGHDPEAAVVLEHVVGDDVAAAAEHDDAAAAAHRPIWLPSIRFSLANSRSIPPSPWFAASVLPRITAWRVPV